MKRNFRVKKRKVIFRKGPIFLVDCDVALSSGRVLSRQILEHPGSVVILPEMSRDHYILVRQFRFAARTSLWELPAGGVDPGETMAQAAKRELMEEIGYRPRRLKKMMKFYPSPGISGEVMHLYHARKLEPAWAEPDEDEEIEVKCFHVRDIERMIRSGQIIDAKTLLAFFYLKSRKKGVK
ncbi:MAG: NUDIX hydrolase [Candidatus Omnitrophota bacterium]|nr:NUDIX hydrolase [Candidatus Omnitrophota bacterium]